MMDTANDASMIASLLDLKLSLDAITTDAFDSAPAACDAVKKSFESFINKRQNRPAELVAKYFDSTLRKKASEADLEALLQRLLVMFRYIQGKDVFEAFYQKDLAKRLLLNKSASMDMESYLLGLLKIECGWYLS